MKKHEPKCILIIEDEVPIREMVCFTLQTAGFTTLEADSWQQARAQLAKIKPALILLDWMLPGINGIDIVKRLRADKDTQDIPIIMLTAKAEEDNRVRGFEAGADDYVIKPFSPRELIARIKAVLRRGPLETTQGQIQFLGLVIDTNNHMVTVVNTALSLSPTEYRLLLFLVTHQRRVYTRAQILDYVWGGEIYVDERTIDVHIRRLRKILGEFGYDKYIQTVRSAGYRFSEETA